MLVSGADTLSRFFGNGFKEKVREMVLPPS
jgi:hypothetical protein